MQGGYTYPRLHNPRYQAGSTNNNNEGRFNMNYLGLAPLALWLLYLSFTGIEK